MISEILDIFINHNLYQKLFFVIFNVIVFSISTSYLSITTKLTQYKSSDYFDENCFKVGSASFSEPKMFSVINTLIQYNGHLPCSSSVIEYNCLVTGVDFIILNINGSNQLVAEFFLYANVIKNGESGYYKEITDGISSLSLGNIDDVKIASIIVDDHRVLLSNGSSINFKRHKDFIQNDLCDILNSDLANCPLIIQQNVPFDCIKTEKMDALFIIGTLLSIMSTSLSLTITVLTTNYKDLKEKICTACHSNYKSDDQTLERNDDAQEISTIKNDDKSLNI